MAPCLGDPETLIPCGDGVGERSQFGQDPRQMKAGEHRRQSRQPEALAERCDLDEGDHRAHGLGRPARFASVPERPAEVIIREDAQPEVADRFGDGAGALRRVDSSTVIAKLGIEVRLVCERPPEPPLVS